MLPPATDACPDAIEPVPRGSLVLANARASASPADFATCRALLRRSSGGFAAASFLLPRRVGEPAAALYAFCSLGADWRGEIPPSAISSLRERLARTFAGRPHDAPTDRAFAAVVAAHSIPRDLLDALVEGLSWDVDRRRYQSLSELIAYAARKGGAVGAMMAVLMGASSPEALARACDLGIAMELTNVARDVGQNAQGGRLYLPLDWLDEAGVDARAFLAAPRCSPELSWVIQRLLGYASTLFLRANLGIALLPRDCRPAICAASLLYSDIGNEIARRGFDSVSCRVSLTLTRRLWIVLSAFFRRFPDVNGNAAGAAPALAESQFLVDAASEAMGRPSKVLLPPPSRRAG